MYSMLQPEKLIPKPYNSLLIGRVAIKGRTERWLRRGSMLFVAYLPTKDGDLLHAAEK
jgi:hypothetical protein